MVVLVNESKYRYLIMRTSFCIVFCLD